MQRVEVSHILLQDFAVGVVDSKGHYRLIDSGPLPEAVAASAAIPFIFAPVDVPGQLLATYPLRAAAHFDLW
jgi:predicted acylesterase/phospholipase RssA